MGITDYDVFISFKNLMPNGEPTRDSALAREVYDYLTAKGFQVFLSNVSLERLGISEYKKAIDGALDVARGMWKPIIPLRIEYVPPRSAGDALRFIESIKT